MCMSDGKKIVMGFKKNDGTIITEQTSLLTKGEYFPILDNYDPKVKIYFNYTF